MGAGDDHDWAEYNRRAWDHQVSIGDRWTLPVDGPTIAAARQGRWSVLLTPARPVPRSWFPADLTGVELLGLASGGGQQCPVFAAAGANVTSFDASEAQLEQDRTVADREGLTIRYVRGDMRDLSAFEDESFDLIFQPVANCFVETILPVWREAARVLRPGGHVLVGFIHPFYYLFDDDKLAQGEYEVRYRVPYRDDRDLDPASFDALVARNDPVMFGHTLEDQIGGQLAAGLRLVGFYEDCWGDDKALDDRIATFAATRAVKPG